MVRLAGCAKEVPTADAWRKRLVRGAEVSLDREPVSLIVDPELGCLEVREHSVLYPLALMSSCSEMPNAEARDAFELCVAFGGLDTLVFQFDEAAERTGFAAALFELSTTARQQGDAIPDECAGEYVWASGSEVEF